MKKIAFFCIPAHGHINPTLPVVRELVERGHEVWYYSYDAMQEKIEQTGAKYISCNRYDNQMQLKPEDGQRIARDLAFAMEVVVNTTLAMDDTILQQMKDWQPDCIVGDSMAFWGKLVAKKLGVPFVSSTTTFAFNRYSAKVMQQGGHGQLKNLLSMVRANRQVRRLREKGYPVKNILSIIANDNATKTIVYTSPQFQPCAETFSDQYAFVGPSVLGRVDPAARTTTPSVYISLGTVVNENQSFYKNCIAGLRDTGWSVTMSVGEGTDIESLGEIPENFTVQQRVDQIQVLQQVHAFLTHCGMNSVNEGLFYEVPLVLFPQTTEESGVAARVRELGAGLLLQENSPQAIRKALTAVLEQPGYRDSARRIAADFRACGGAKQAADRILEAAR